MSSRRRRHLLVAALVAVAAAVAGYLLLPMTPARAPGGPRAARPAGTPRHAPAPAPSPAAATAVAPALPVTDGGRPDAGVSLAIQGTVTVTVHDPEGRPDANVDVELVWHGAPKPGQALGATPFLAQDVPPMSPTRRPDGKLGPDEDQTTDADGRAVFTGLLAGYYQASAAGPVGPSTGAWFGIDAGRPHMDVTLTLVAVTRLDVTVVDPGGAPIAGAEFRGRMWLATTDPEAVTDAQGRTTLAVPRSGGTVLRVTATGFAATEQPFGPDGPHRVTLKRAATVTGKVIADGAPVAGASVSPSLERGSPPATTGDDGTFTLEGLPRRILDLEAKQGSRHSRDLQVDLRKGNVSGVVLTLLAQESLDVHVVTPGGDPVPDARVRLAEMGDDPTPGDHPDAKVPWFQWHPVDEDGHLVMTPLPRHNVYVAEAEAPGRPRVQAYYPVDRGGKVPVRIVLPEGTEVALRILDPQGRPLSGHDGTPTLTVQPVPGDSDIPMHLPLPEGKTEVDPVLGPGHYLVGAEVFGGLVVPPRKLTVPGSASLDLQEVQGATLTGRAVDPRGHGVPGLQLTLEPAPGTHAGMNYASTGDDGQLDGQGPMPRGTYVPHFLMSGPRWRIPPGTTLKAGAGFQTLHVLPAETLEGDLLDARGRRVPYVNLKLVHLGAPALTIIGNSGTTGHFVVGHLAPGRYTLTVPASKPPIKPVTVTAGTKGVVVRVPPQHRRSAAPPDGGSPP